MSTIKELAAHLNSQMERVLDKVDDLSDKVGHIERNVDRNTVSLEEHIKRTNLLEQQMKKVEEKHLNCPAVKAHETKNGMISMLRDILVVISAITAIVGLLQLLK